ncbi:unnamed protein product [Rotaria sp. Silwood2]|nr:unnamed protein product [Rotaria sp. Silwood2]CAF2889992.1 unnamed protein product [Rotaria sp. Silwood2]CAF3858040.1 unnamed protein product [Rotaria sp. Silwood2]CAF3953134.1 unnamed protein product [Rotaria sp. Silwood2]
MKILVISLILIVVSVCFADITIYRGTACGWAELTTSSPILCNGSDPRHKCPSGYSRQIFTDGGAYCYKNNTTTSKQNGIPGTLCGGLARTLCGGLSPNKECPKGYTQDFRYICYKNDPTIEDLSGTVCGVISGYKGPTCDRLSIGTCPEGYYGIDFEKEGWHACFKK